MIRLLIFIIYILFLSSCIENENPVPTLQNRYLESKKLYVNQIIEGETINRSVIIQAPLEIDKNHVIPIVIGLHGRGGSNTSWTHLLKHFTDAGDFIGVYPQGYLNSWNLGKEPSKADDVAFVEEIIDTLLTYSNVDADKIFVIGSSNGAGMAHKLGAESNRIRAIAPIASQLIESISMIPNKKPLSVFQINGDKDTVVPIEGGDRLGHSFLSALESAEKWSSQFHCSQTEDIIETDTTLLHAFTNCDNDVAVKYLIIKGAGHNIGAYYPQLWNVVWDFFSALD